MAGVELKNVSKSFGSVNVIKGVDLKIEEGDFTVFVGPSGCGKSTLLRLVAGLEDVTDGTISIAGSNVTHFEPSDRGVAMVFQSYALYPHMTVAENMGFGLKMTGYPADEISRRVKRAADILHLEPLLDRKPKAMSGGQRQRVAIGRAIVREPKVFLFDEPLSNLDAELRVQMRLEIAKLHNDLGATMIYVTHDQVEAMTLADKIVVLRAGVLEQYGTPMALYTDPDNVFVAGFIGSPKMNFLPATVTGTKNGKCSVEINGYGDPVIALKLANAPIAGTDILVGIRPEHFREGGKASLTAEIDVIENLGGTSYAYVSGTGGEPLTVELSGNEGAARGKTVKFSFAAESALAFDPKTELRIR